MCAVWTHRPARSQTDASAFGPAAAQSSGARRGRPARGKHVGDACDLACLRHEVVGALGQADVEAAAALVGVEIDGEGLVQIECSAVHALV